MSQASATTRGYDPNAEEVQTQGSTGGVMTNTPGGTGGFAVAPHTGKGSEKPDLPIPKPKPKPPEPKPKPKPDKPKIDLTKPADLKNPLPLPRNEIPADKDNPLPLPPGDKPGVTKTGLGTQVIPGDPGADPNSINVVDWAGLIAGDPSLGFIHDDPSTKDVNESMLLEQHLSSNKEIQKMMDEGKIDPKQAKYKMDANKLAINAIMVKQQTNPGAASYNVQKIKDAIAANDMKAAKGQLSAGSQVQAAQIDIDKIANDPTNALGSALKKYAAQDFTNIIDTSTAAGKLLAQKLGDGNYTDSKATLKGQLEMLQSEFVDPTTGEPKIPSWAASTSRNVSKIAAFKGMSGSAATAAMSQALMEASIPIAQADAQFFQTLTIQNLNNKQQSIINTANTLAKFEQTNVDNRMAAAIQNSKAFLEMDMANLSNEQQARVINNAARTQSILEDAKQENAKRLFVADNENDMNKFYAQLNTQISQYNSSQNLDAKKFNSTLNDSREKFYKEMQYNIDVSNAKWRQTVQLQEDQQRHEAATTDVKNMFDLSVNQLNQIWDRSDSLLDYAWKSSESNLDRRNSMALAILAGKNAKDAALWEGIGTLAGTFVGSGVGQNLLSSIFG